MNGGTCLCQWSPTRCPLHADLHDLDDVAAEFGIDLDDVFATMPERYLEDLRQSMDDWAALTFPIAAETWPES